MDQILQNLFHETKSSFVKSWLNIQNQKSLHLFYNHETLSFSAVIQTLQDYQFIPSTKDGFELIKVPFLASQVTKDKLSRFQPSQLLDFFRRELRYPLIKETENNDICNIQLNIGGLLGGGGKVSKVHNSKKTSKQQEEPNFKKDSPEYKVIFAFLKKRYRIDYSKTEQPTTKDANRAQSQIKDKELVEGLTMKICHVLPNDQSSRLEKYLSKSIDAYEELFFDQVVLETLGKKIEEGKPTLADYTQRFASRKLCLELLRKGYFAKERARGGIGLMVSERILARLSEETRPFFSKSDKNVRKEGESFNDLLLKLEMKEQVKALLKPLTKVKAKSVMESITMELGLKLDQVQDFDEFNFALVSKEKFHSLKTGNFEAFKSRSASLPEPYHSRILSVPPSAGIKPSEKITSEADDIGGKSKYLDKIRLNVLSEMNLLDHDPSTLVELHNLLDLDAEQSVLGQKKQSNNPSHSKLDDIKNLLRSLITGYHENESHLEPKELESLIPLAFVYDRDIFRKFLEAFLEDFRNDILFSPHKVKMLSFILMSTLRDKKLKGYIVPDDLLSIFKILKPKLESLSITSGNINLQEALNSLNDVLFLMGFIKAEGVRESDFNAVLELLTNMQTHMLEKVFNTVRSASKDPSLEIKREYAIESLKRIGGTEYAEWQDRWTSCIEIGQIAVDIGKGIFLGDLSSLSEALLQAGGLVAGYLNNRPKNWFDAANRFRFLSQESIRKIIVEIFSNQKFSNRYVSFYAAELLFLVLAQPNRQLLEKKIAIQALWFLAHGYDILLSNSLEILVKSRVHKHDKDIHHYIKEALKNIASNSNTELNFFILNLLETPLKVEVLSRDKADVWNEILNYQSKKEQKQDGGNGVPFFMKVLMEKKPKLYALARIQKRSEKTLVKPAILIEFRGIDREKDFDDAFDSKIKEKVENITNEEILKNLASIKKVKQYLDLENATKKSLFDLFDNPKRYHIGDKNKEKTEQKAEEENENQQENKEKESQNPTAREEGAAKEEGDDKEGANKEEGKVKEEDGKKGKKQEGEELDEENETERRGNDENKKPENGAKTQEEDNAQKKEKEKKEKALKNARDKVIKEVNNKIIPEIVEKGRANLFETLEDFLNDPTKSVLLIQGEAGTGKTLLLGLIEEKLWKRYNILTKANMKNPNRLPLRIILSEVRTFETAVEEFLRNYGCGFDEIQEIKKEPAVILFDGYDEINQTINLYDKNKLEMWRDVKVIFTSRKENLTSLKEDYITCFAPNKDRNKVLSHSILPIGRDQIKKYFSAQINENLEKIEKLEKELSEKNGNGERTMPVTANLKRKIEYLQKFFETDRYESSLDILKALEERIPKMEKAEIGEAGNETDGIRLELLEIFKKRVAELKRFTDSKNIETFKEEIKKNQSVTEKLETDLDLLNTAIGSYGALAVQKSAKKTKVLTNLKEILQEISGNFEPIEKKISKLNRHLKKHSSRLTTAKDALQAIKDKATSTYFKKLFERLVEKMEEIKKTEKQIKPTGASCTTYLSKELALLDEQTYIGQLEKTIQGLSTLLEQLNTVHKSLEWLYLEDEDEVEQQPQQPTQDKNSTQEDRRSFDKLQKPISTLQTLLKSFKESAKEMKVFDKDFINHEKLRRSLENLLYDSGFDPEQSMIDAISDSYWDFKNITGEIAAFRKEGKRSDDMTVPVIEFIKELLELIHLESVQFIFKKLEDQIKQAQQTIKTKGNRIGKANIDKIEELHKRLKDIENSDETEYMDQIQIQDLNEMVEEILELEKESKTIKDRDNVELPLRIKAIGEEMLTLEKFTDPQELDSIIENFEDIVSPFMLKMLLDTLIRVPKSASNKADLYELFSKIHFEREKDKLIMNEKIPPKFNIIASFYHFSKDLAVNMFIKKVTSIQAKSNGYKVLGGSGATRKNVWNRFFDDKDVITRLSRRGAQIIEDDGMVRFIHKSVMEYFAAKQFYDEIAEYDADNPEIYDPWLNMGPLVDNETAVYRFINDIADSKERAERSHEKEKARIKNNGDNDDYDEDDKEKEKKKDNANDQKDGESEGKNINEQPKSQNDIANSQIVEKNSSSKERIIFDKKIVEIFTSIPLQKEYGGDLDQKHFYSNLFLLLLSRKGLVKRLLEEKEEIVPLSAINNIFEWIFSRSEASWKFVETIGTMGDYIPNGYKSFWPLLLEYYHFKTNPINKPTNLANKSAQNEVFLESHSQHPIRLIPSKPKGEVIGSFIPNKNKDGVVDDEKETPSFKWEMDAKLFLHGSQESVVVLKASGFNNHRYFSLDTKQTASENPFTLIDTKTPWEIKECKWMLQLNFPDKLMFKLRSLADSSKILCGTFKEAKDYEWFFPEMCTCDVHGGSVCDAVYICSTCETENPELKGYIYCKNCKEACHKKHNIVLYNETGKTGGYCDCRFVGTCKIAVGCTSRFNKKYNKDSVMWKCNQCPDEKKNIVFCTGCKKHHDQTHVSFEKVTGCQECKCDCVSNRIKILPTRKLEYFDKDDDKIELSEDTWADEVNVYVASDDEDDDKEDENKEGDEDEDGGDDDDDDGDGDGVDDDDDDNGNEDEDDDVDDGGDNDDDEDEEDEDSDDDDDNDNEDEDEEDSDD